MSAIADTVPFITAAHTLSGQSSVDMILVIAGNTSAVHGSNIDKYGELARVVEAKLIKVPSLPNGELPRFEDPTIPVGQRSNTLQPEPQSPTHPAHLKPDSPTPKVLISKKKQGSLRPLKVELTSCLAAP
ncbi:MAG: hypothetical protein AAGC88_07405 [Bacteroidota bacterium]